jgi:hypothetical protein
MHEAKTHREEEGLNQTTHATSGWKKAPVFSLDSSDGQYYFSLGLE